MKQTKETKEVMDIKGLAEYLQMSKHTLYRKVEKGTIPGAKIGKKWKFAKAVIDTWLKDQMLKGYTGKSLTELKAAARVANLLK